MSLRDMIANGELGDDVVALPKNPEEIPHQKGSFFFPQPGKVVLRLPNDLSTDHVVKTTFDIGGGVQVPGLSFYFEDEDSLTFVSPEKYAGKTVRWRTSTRLDYDGVPDVFYLVAHGLGEPVDVQTAEDGTLLTPLGAFAAAIARHLGGTFAAEGYFTAFCNKNKPARDAEKKELGKNGCGTNYSSFSNERGKTKRIPTSGGEFLTKFPCACGNLLWVNYQLKAFSKA